VDAPTLLRAVDAAFAETGAATPGWPNPHPGDVRPAEEEYSRESDPAKYRILGARAQAWSRALVATGLATLDAPVDKRPRWRGPLTTALPVLDIVRLRPADAGAVPLLLATREEVKGLATIVSVGAGDPAHEVDLVPDCSCDACDLGSDDLLEALDDRVLDVVSGALVHVLTPEGYVQPRRDGGGVRSGGRTPVDYDQVLADVEAGRSSYPVVRGEPWW